MLMFIGFILIGSGVVTTLVGEICKEGNEHQLWER